ncbi:unnamed protein product, partial [Lepidochelys olivacea]
IQNIVLKHQAFGLNEDEPTSPFCYSYFSGIWGMVYPGLVMTGHNTVLQEMVQSRASLLNPSRDSISPEPTYNYGGDIMFGCVDPQLFPSQITWTSVTGSSVLRSKEPLQMSSVESAALFNSSSLGRRQNKGRNLCAVLKIRWRDYCLKRGLNLAQ